MADELGDSPAWEASVEHGLLDTAQHPDNGIGAWDGDTIRSLLLLRRALGASLRLFVTKHSTQILRNVTALPNLKELHLLKPEDDRWESNLRPLLSTPGLTELQVLGWRLRDLTILAQLPLLRVLDLQSACIGDVSGLRSLMLHTLNLTSTDFKDLSPLSQMQSLEYLDLSQCRELANVDALAHLTRLKCLNLDSTTKPDIGPIAQLNLKTLILSDRRVPSLAPISMMTALEDLELNCFIGAVDISALAQLTCLSRLQMLGMLVSDLNPVNRLHLRSLNLNNAQVTSLEPLAGIQSLTELQLMACPISTVTALSGLSCLKQLRLDQIADLADLSPIQSLPLEVLNAKGTLVSDLRPLAGMATLQALDLCGCPVADIAHLAQLTQLQALELGETHISDASALGGLQQLVQLSLSRTQVRDVRALAAMHTLQQLHLKECPVCDITPLAKLTGLQMVDLSGTQVSDVSALYGLQLTRLVLSKAPVRDVRGLADMPTLRQLRLDHYPAALAASSPGFARWLGSVT